MTIGFLPPNRFNPRECKTSNRAIQMLCHGRTYIGNLRPYSTWEHSLTSCSRTYVPEWWQTVKYVSTICALLGDTVYLVYVLLLWLCLRIYRRLKAQARQQQLAFEAKAEGVLQHARVQ